MLYRKLMVSGTGLIASISLVLFICIAMARVGSAVTRQTVTALPEEKQHPQNVTSKTYLPANWPAWSPDGKELIFASFLSQTGREPVTLWIYNLEDATLQQPVLRYGMTRSAWSPDKRLIAYENHGDIYIYDLKTKRLHPLFSKGGTGNGRDPTWGPDSRSLAFSSSRNGTTDIYIAQLDLSSDQIRKSYRKVSSLSIHGDNNNPVWSRDGKWIAFTHEFDFGIEYITQEIYVVHPDGSGLKRVCRLPPNSTVERLSWIPGKHKLIINRISGGSGKVEITEERPQNLPDWEKWFDEGGMTGSAINKYGGYYEKGREGKYLVFHFSTDTKGRYLFWKDELVVNTETSKLEPFKLPYDNQPFTEYPKGATQISPSPDGKRMAFITESTDGHTVSVWVANIDGSNPVELKARWPSPKPGVPIITKVGPGFPVPLIMILGDPVTIDANIFHPSGWDGIKEVTFHLSNIKDDSKDIEIRYDKATQKFYLRENQKQASKPIRRQTSDFATQGGITMFGKDSLVEPAKYGGRVQVSFKAQGEELVGEWYISIEVITKLDKKFVTNHVGVLKVRKTWF